MGDDDLDLLHVGHYRGMTTDVATGLSRATAQQRHRAGARDRFGTSQQRARREVCGYCARPVGL